MNAQINQMSDLELNRALHEARGLCWHECKKTSSYLKRCSKCLQLLGNSYQTGFDRNPNYCRSLDTVAKVEKEVIERVGFVEYGKCFWEVCMTGLPIEVYESTKDYLFQTGMFATATARQRAEACLLISRRAIDLYEEEAIRQ